MPGGGPADLERLRVEHQINRRGIHRLVVLPQDHVEVVIQSLQQFAGMAGFRLHFLDQRAQHGGDHGRPHAVAHHVADKNARRPVGNPPHVEKIAGDPPRRQVTMMKPHSGRGRRERRIRLRQHGALHFARHDEFLFHLEVLAFNLNAFVFQQMDVVEQESVLQAHQVAHKN